MLCKVIISSIVPKLAKISYVINFIRGKIVDCPCPIDVKPAVRICKFIVSLDEENILIPIIIYHPFIRLCLTGNENEPIIVNMNVSTKYVLKIDSLDASWVRILV